jgi:adenylate cyclase
VPPDDEPARRARGRLEGTAERARRTDEHPRLVSVARYLRSRLPGDSELGDPLSTAGDRAPHVLARGLSDAAPARDSLTRELGLGALQVWQAVSEAQGRGRGDEEVAILFTDLVQFSAWALEAGDEAAVKLLREVARAIEPAITVRDGRIVKRLGDGLLAVFPDPQAGVEAAQEAVARTARVEVAGHSPRLRAGLHVGRPRKLGGDYLGVDVNIAARVAEAAGPGEVLVSEAGCRNLAEGAFRVRRKRRFRAKGAPRDLSVFSVERA